jgi:REP element-mobilizing transposase RayT
MARKPRIHFPGALYHVIARGNRGQKIYRDDSDYELYLQFLEEYKERYRFALYAYALLPNHLHLLIEVGEIPLSRLMQTLQFRYTRNFNIKYRKFGHLFQGRYKAILCEKDAYLVELSAYIHLNGVRARLAGDPIEYPWSSYRIYMSEQRSELVDKELILAQFSKKRKIAVKGYENFVKERTGQGHVKAFYELKDQRLLGEDEFVEEVHRGLNEDLSFVYDIRIREMVSEVGLVLKIPTEFINSADRNRLGALGRGVVGLIGRKLGGHTIKAVAEHFNRDPVAITQGVKKVETKLREESDFKQAIEKIEKGLTKKRQKKYLNTYA